MSDDLAEEFARLTQPELYAALDDAFAKAARNVEFPSPSFALSRRRELIKRYLGQYDRAILSAARMSLDDLVAAREARLRKRHAGQRLAAGRANVEQRKTALLAIHRADQSGLGWGETIAAVQAATMAAHNREHDRKTIGSWLRTLHGWGLIHIEQPSTGGRGRPRKKE